MIQAKCTLRKVTCVAMIGVLSVAMLSSCFGRGHRSHSRSYDYDDYQYEKPATEDPAASSSVQQSSATEEMFACPVCNGTGKNLLSEDIMAQTLPCSCCGGSGMTTSSGYMSFVELYSSMNGGYSNGGGYSGGNTRDYNECVSCYGRGTCWMCGGKGWNSYSGYGYSGISECPTCNGTGRCQFCGGSGRK